MTIDMDIFNYSQDEIELWELMESYQGKVLTTFRGLEFTYWLRGNELFISRRTKTITRSTVNIAYHAAMELMKTCGYVNGPKKLGTFGSSYLYPIFIAIGVIKQR
ncbi:MAG: hypothetical protein HFE63_11335 [Clostridiales bacterium]|nr:hypothetical protein [Clostridiales bacterium]